MSGTDVPAPVLFLVVGLESIGSDGKNPLKEGG